jgi:hypothetical protein
MGKDITKVYSRFGASGQGEMLEGGRIIFQARRLELERGQKLNNYPPLDGLSPPTVRQSPKLTVQTSSFYKK